LIAAALLAAKCFVSIEAALPPLGVAPDVLRAVLDGRDCDRDAKPEWQSGLPTVYRVDPSEDGLEAEGSVIPDSPPAEGVLVSVCVLMRHTRGREVVCAYRFLPLETR